MAIDLNLFGYQATPPRDPTPPPSAAGGFFDSVLKSRLFEVALLSALFFDPSGNVPSPVTPDGWEPQPASTERIAKPFPAKLQDFGGYPVEGNVPTAFVGNGWTTVWDGPARKRFPAAEQQFTAWKPRGDLVSTPQGWPAVFPERFTKPVPVSLQRFDHFPQYQVPTAFVGNAWTVQWDGPASVRQPFPVRLQQFEGYPPLGNVPSRFVGNAWISFPDRFAAKFPAAAQLFSAFPQYQVATATTPQGWPAVFPEIFQKPGLARLQQFSWSFEASTTVVVVYPDGWSVWSPERFARPFPATELMFAAFQPAGTIVSVTPQGFGAVWADQRRVPPLADGRFADNPLTVATTPQGWGSAAPDARGRPLSPALARFSDDPLPAIAVIATPQGWQPEFAVRPRLKAPAASIELSVARGNVPTAATPQGWPSVFPERFARPFPAGLQADRSGYPAQGNVASPVTPQGWTPIFPERFAAPVRASLQLFQFMHWWKTVEPAPIIAQPTLRGTDAAPTLLGTDAAPTLSGKLALTINLTGKVGA